MSALLPIGLYFVGMLAGYTLGLTKGNKRLLEANKALGGQMQLAELVKFHSKRAYKLDDLLFEATHELARYNPTGEVMQKIVQLRIAESEGKWE